MAAPLDTFVLDSSTKTFQLLPTTLMIPMNETERVTFYLPDGFQVPVGQRSTVAGFGAGGWKITQNAGQTIYFMNQHTTTGVTGSLQSVEPTAGVSIVCVEANTTFVVITSNGNITIT